MDKLGTWLAIGAVAVGFVVLLWLLFCGWLWSIPGVLLAVPMLVCFKIVAERVPGLNGWSAIIR